MNLSDKKINKMRVYIGKYYSQNSSPNDRRRILDESSSELGENYEMRDEFTRDKDRIIHTKAFRRLQHKAQVYSHEKSDHYRTRLTHTIEVNQIARAIARNLNVNEDLTEAIALGHDIGHTPFGHVGEEVLDKIMRGKDNLGEKLKYDIDYGGFKHNFNSLKILELVENRYENKNGLNLTWQVLDGIVKHTSIRKNDDKYWNWERFVDDSNFFSDLIGYSYYNNEVYTKFPIGVPLTIEGQIVLLSDEIAQREHDLDDSVRNQNYIFSNLKEIMDNTLNSINEDMGGYNLFIKLKNKLDLENIPTYNLDEYFERDVDLIWDYCIKCILSYFIRDVTENSMLLIYNADRNQKIIKKEYGKKYKRKYICGSLIKFSEVGEIFNETIENFIENKIINSYEVNRFDGKGKFILRQLFKAYYENPKQMPQSQLKILDNMLKDNYHKFGELKLGSKDISDIKFINKPLNHVSNSDINDLIDSLKLENEEFKGLISQYSEEEFYKMVKTDSFNNDTNNILKHYSENHYAYLYVISNYISKMTDNYAEKEYKNLYLGS